MLSNGRSRLIQAFQGRQAGLGCADVKLAFLFKINATFTVIPTHASAALYQSSDEAPSTHAAEDGLGFITHLCLYLLNHSSVSRPEEWIVISWNSERK